MTTHNIKIRVPALARVEGEGALVVDVHEGEITHLQLRIYEPPRYFEKFLEGREYTDIPEIVARICGICPVAYQMSAVQAIESIFDVQVSQWVEDMRRVMYCGEWIQSHSLHIHMLAAPDFLGFNSITEMAKKYPAEVQRGLRLQSIGNKLIALFGGRSVHPVGVRAGGFHHAPNVDEVTKLLKEIDSAVDEAADLLRWTGSLSLPDIEQSTVYVALRNETQYAINDGRIMSNTDVDLAASEYTNRFSECHVPHSTALHATLDGKPYLVGPLARMNLNFSELPENVQTILAEIGIRFPCHNMFYSIIARAAELMAALLEAQRLLGDYKPETPYVDVSPKAGVGYGCTEAPRGILWHRYELDDNGRIVEARIVPPTSQNQARIEEDLRYSLTEFGLDKDEQDLRLHGEKVIRNYDPCISCATHFLKLELNRQGYSEQAINALSERLTAGDTITILGVGSPVHGDTLGQEVIALLKKQGVFDNNTNVRLKSLERPGMNVVEEIRQAKCLLIIDAMQGDTTHDGVVIVRGNELVGEASVSGSHELGVADAISLADSLGLDTENVLIIGMLKGDKAAWSNSDVEHVVNRLEALVAKIQS